MVALVTLPSTLATIRSNFKNKIMKVVTWSVVLLTLCSLRSAFAWDNDDLEIFDLVELINLNFYKLMGINEVRFHYVDEYFVLIVLF